MPFFGLVDEEDSNVFLIVYYYAFTSLTTVGLGDLRPVSDIERLFCAFMLFFGVLVFSYIMGEYIELLDKYKAR